MIWNCESWNRCKDNVFYYIFIVIFFTIVCPIRFGHVFYQTVFFGVKTFVISFLSLHGKAIQNSHFKSSILIMIMQFYYYMILFLGIFQYQEDTQPSFRWTNEGSIVRNKVGKEVDFIAFSLSYKKMWDFKLLHNFLFHFWMNPIE